MSMTIEKPDFEFEDGSLAIKMKDRSVHIRIWPDPYACIAGKDGTKEEFKPEFRLIRPEMNGSMPCDGQNRENPSKNLKTRYSVSGIENQKREAFTCLRAQLPEHVAKAVEAFTNHQWNLLDLISKEEAALELAENNPILSWFLANNDQFRKLYGSDSPVARARPRLPQKQVEILDWLGFPASNAFVRLIRKIPPEAIAPSDARMLRRAVKEPEVVRSLAHLRVVNAGVLGLVNNLKLFAFVSPRLLGEVAESQEEKVQQPTADRLVDALYIITLGQLHLRVPKFHSIRAIGEFHDRVVAEWQKKIEEADNKPAERISKRKIKKPKPKPPEFPPPPVPGTPGIIPLDTKKKLNAESRVQHNCVRSYDWKVITGNTYIYKVLKPERATLAITRGPDNFWRRSEIFLAGNRAVSIETKFEVDQWLDRYSFSA